MLLTPRSNWFLFALAPAGLLQACGAAQATITPQASPVEAGESRGADLQEADVKPERLGPVARFKLDNGLTVLLQSRRVAPVVAVQVWVGVGSADEGAGEEGLAHLHEHMLFKGTKRFAVGEIAKAIEGAGGEINAWTSFDHTVYHVVLASRFLDLGLQVLADAVQNSSFDPRELEREKKVVFEEIKRSRDLPGRRVNDLLFDTTFKQHPYRRPVLGSVASLQSVGRDGILDFFHRHYTPERMTVVVVGDFDEPSVAKKIRALFGHARPGPQAEAGRPAEPSQRKLRVRVESDDIQEAYFSLGWHIGTAASPDLPALDLLATLLGQGESGRLMLELKRAQGLVNDVYAYAYAPKDPGLFVVGGTCRAEKTLDALRGLAFQASRLGAVPVSAGELSKVKAMIESDAIYAQETVEGTSRRIGYYQALLGDPQAGDVFLGRVAAVTPEELKRVARAMLDADNLSLVLLLPKGVTLGEEEVRKALQEGFAAAPSEPPSAPEASTGEVTRVSLPHGPVLLVEEDHTTPLVAFRAAFLGGLRFETDADNGINNLMAGLLTRGTTTRSASEIAKSVDALAGGLSGYSGRNSFGLRGEFPSKHFEKGLALFADCLLHSTFPEKELKRERELVLEEIRARDDNLSGLAFDLFAATLYPSHPYRLPILGSRASVASLRRPQLQEWMASRYTPERMVLSMVGDVETDQVVAAARALFSGSKAAKPAAAPKIALDPAQKEIRTAFRSRPKAQAHVVLGFLGTALQSDDRFAVEVLMAVLAGQGGRLFVELRDRAALAYAVTGFSLEGIEPGYIAVYLGVDPTRVDEAIAAVKRELAQVVEKPIPKEELARAQRYLVGADAIALQKTSARAAVMAFDEAYGLGHLAHRQYADHILGVTAADLQRAARKYLTLDAYTLAVISPRKEEAPATSSGVSPSSPP